MQIILISREVFYELRELQQRNRPFNFSCNDKREVWPPPGDGYTQPEDRDYVQGAYEELDKIAEIVLSEDRIGGRFYLTDDGAFLSRDDKQIVEFIFVG